MATLDKNILNEFAKTVTAEQQKDDGILVYGIVTRLTDDGAIVRLDGKTDNTLTPCATGVSVTVGDRVTVNIGRNQAVIIANSTTNPTPGADSKLVGSGKIIADYINASFVKTDVLEANYVATTYLEANYLKTGQLDAQYATIAELIANYIKTTQLNAEVANLGYLKADSATITNLVTETAKVQDLTAEQLNAATAYIADLQTESISVQDISAATGYIGTLESNNVTANNIVADTAKVHNLTAEQLSAATGYVGSLVSNNITANDIEADHATIGSLDTNYAQIDLANVTNAWIQNGTIKDAAISDAQIIGVSANKLTAGIIDARDITVTNLNASNITTGSITVDGITIDVENNEASIDGSYIKDGTITMNGFAQEVKDVIDGAIETFTGTVVPTLNNYPASSWTDNDTKAKHVGDIYYVVNAGQEADGYCYRFAYDNTTSSYKWSLIQDSDVTAALSRLQTAEGKIEGLETFETNTAVWKNETDESISTLITSTTNLSASIGPINLIPESYDNELRRGTSYTLAGITWTVNTDGSITATGTATASQNYYISQMLPSRNTDGVPCIPIVLNKTYTLSGCPATGSNTTYYMRVQYRNTSGSFIGSSIYDYGSGVTFTPTSENCYGLDIFIFIYNGFACPTEGLTFRPMLEYGSEAHEYIPPRAGLKVSTSTFNSLESTVNSNTAAITSLSETVENKADSSTVTTLSNTVNSVQQTANSNSSKITNLTTVLGTNTDGTTSANDIVHKVSEIDQDLDSITTRVGKTEVLLTGTFATSSTAAATTAKVATITPAITGYTLTTGASITVKFTTANTSTAPTLNVNSTGAKAIRNYSGSALTAAEYSWKAGDTFDFVYDGQYWRMQDSTTATRLSSTETSISENAEAITLRATKTEVSNAISDAESYADSAVSTAKAEIKVTTDGITAEVNSLSTTVDGKADSSTVAALSQDLNGFKATVSSTYSTKTELNDVQSQVDNAIVDTTQLWYSTEAVSNTLTGDIVSFDDPEDERAIKSLTASITAVQSGSGDPSPTNVRPISGWDAVNATDCGKNLLDESIIQLGSYLPNGTTTVDGDDKYRRFRIDLPAGTYTFSTDLADCYIVRILVDNVVRWEKLTTQSYTFTLANASNVKFAIRNTSSTAITASFYMQIEFGSTATAYEPYTGTTKTISLGSTCYGGTLDVTNGVLTVTHDIVDFVALDWTYHTTGGGYFRTKSLADYKKYGLDNLLSSHYSVDTHTAQNMADGTLKGASDSGYVYVKNLSYTDAATFKTAMDGVQLVYELVEPQIIQLTPTQVQAIFGKNNLWADSGNVEVTCTIAPDAPAPPIEHVINTSVLPNAWTKSVPEYNTSTPYIYYCYEFLKNDDTYSWSDVVLNNSVTGGIKYLENNINSQLAAANQQIQLITENYSTIEQTNNAITSTVGTLETRIYGDGTSANKGSISELQTSIEQTSKKISFITSENQNTYAKMGSTFSFEGYTFKITTDGAEIHSEQGADFYKYVDTATNTVFGIDKNGTKALQANVTGQIGVGSGSVENYQEQWAIRKGEYVSNVGYNLDFVWVGGNN